jgi:hypothetical protein
LLDRAGLRTVAVTHEETHRSALDARFMARSRRATNWI